MLIELVGWLGTFLVVLAYYFLETDKVEETSFSYRSLNIAGALMLGVNAYAKQAFAILALQAVWILISVVGIWKNKSAR